MRKSSLILSLATLLLLLSPLSFGETIDNMWCQKAAGFNERMQNQGFKRELTMPFGWGDYDNSVSHNISGSHVQSYDKNFRNRWALYTKGNGQWKIFQAVTRTNITTGAPESFVCEVKSGSGLVRH
jgi:hypothetical protein